MEMVNEALDMRILFGHIHPEGTGSACFKEIANVLGVEMNVPCIMVLNIVS